jgi:hypothetical protein
MHLSRKCTVIFLLKNTPDSVFFGAEKLGMTTEDCVIHVNGLMQDHRLSYYSLAFTFCMLAQPMFICKMKMLMACTYCYAFLFFYFH